MKPIGPVKVFCLMVLFAVGCHLLVMLIGIYTSQWLLHNLQNLVLAIAVVFIAAASSLAGGWLTLGAPPLMPRVFMTGLVCVVAGLVCFVFITGAIATFVA